MNAATSKDRAMLALNGIVGGGEFKMVSGGMRAPFGLRMIDRPLILIAGDQNKPLDHTLLRPLAIKERCDVVATYVDDFRSDHWFVFDVVLFRRAEAVHHAELRLCLIAGRPPIFIPERGPGPSVQVVAGRLRTADRPAGLTKDRRLIGIAQGQAELQRRVHSGFCSDDRLDG